jgi:hypothetical protein
VVEPDGLLAGTDSMLDANALRACTSTSNLMHAVVYVHMYTAQVRDPVVINISYFFHFKDSPRPEDQQQVIAMQIRVQLLMCLLQDCNAASHC